MQSDGIYQRRLSTESTSSCLSAASPDSSLSFLASPVRGQALFTDPFESTYTFPPIQSSNKPGVKVMKAGYSRVKKTTTSMFKAKARPTNVYLTPSTPPDQEARFSIAELNARLEMLNSYDSNLDVPAVPMPSIPHASLVPPYPTPRWEKGAPLWPETSSREPHPEPGILTAKSWTEQASLYFAAQFIAIPNMALSWPPMTIAVIIVSSIAILCGYRYAIIIPVLMLLNPASPLWRNGDMREKGGEVLVLSPQHSPNPQPTHHKPRSPHPHQRRRPSPPTRRHSTAI